MWQGHGQSWRSFFATGTALCGRRRLTSAPTAPCLTSRRRRWPTETIHWAAAHAGIERREERRDERRGKRRRSTTTMDDKLTQKCASSQVSVCGQRRGRRARVTTGQKSNEENGGDAGRTTMDDKLTQKSREQPSERLRSKAWATGGEQG